MYASNVPWHEYSINAEGYLLLYHWITIYFASFHIQSRWIQSPMTVCHYIIKRQYTHTPIVKDLTWQIFVTNVTFYLYSWSLGGTSQSKCYQASQTNDYCCKHISKHAGNHTRLSRVTWSDWFSYTPQVVRKVIDLSDGFCCGSLEPSAENIVFVLMKKKYLKDIFLPFCKSLKPPWENFLFWFATNSGLEFLKVLLSHQSEECTVPITHKFIEKRACFFFRRAWLAPIFLIRRALFNWQARLSCEGSSLRRARLKYRLACQTRQARLYKPPGTLAGGVGRAWRSSQVRPHFAMSESGLCTPTVSEFMRAFVRFFFFFFSVCNGTISFASASAMLKAKFSSCKIHFEHKTFIIPKTESNTIETCRIFV